VVAAGVEFSVLGPVRAWRDGREVDLGSPQQCGVLGLLLLGGGRPVAVETLVDQLWGELAPSSARETVRTYLSRLRRTLPAGESGSMIDSGRGGYALPLGPDSLDLLVFEDRVARARRARADGDNAAAAGLLREALALWRGPALAGARGKFVAHERARLDQLRLVALEERLALDLDLGRHGEVLAEVASLVVGYPLQERLRELQMLALYGVPVRPTHSRCTAACAACWTVSWASSPAPTCAPCTSGCCAPTPTWTCRPAPGRPS